MIKQPADTQIQIWITFPQTFNRICRMGMITVDQRVDFSSLEEGGGV